MYEFLFQENWHQKKVPDPSFTFFFVESDYQDVLHKLSLTILICNILLRLAVP